MRNDSSPEVLSQYVKIANDLRSKIEDGTYPPGALLPSRNEITAMYGVAPITARDALAIMTSQGYALPLRGRGHIVRRKRSRRTLASHLYVGEPDTDPLEMQELDIFQESPPDGVALRLEAGDASVWTRRAIYKAPEDQQPIKIHMSWITGLGREAEKAIRKIDPHVPWPEAVQQLTGRGVASVQQNTRVRSANPFEARVFELPDSAAVFVSHLTTYDDARCPIEHSRYTWPTDAIRISERYDYNA